MSGGGKEKSGDDPGKEPVEACDPDEKPAGQPTVLCEPDLCAETPCMPAICSESCEPAGCEPSCAQSCDPIPT